VTPQAAKQPASRRAATNLDITSTQRMLDLALGRARPWLSRQSNPLDVVAFPCDPRGRGPEPAAAARA
jgi:hypothetical protein